VSTVGIRQFREQLTTYIDSGLPVDVTRHGQVVGVFVPTLANRPFNREALLAAGSRVDAELAAHGIDPDEVATQLGGRSRQPA